MIEEEWSKTLQNKVDTMLEYAAEDKTSQKFLDSLDDCSKFFGMLSSFGYDCERDSKGKYTVSRIIEARKPVWQEEKLIELTLDIISEFNNAIYSELGEYIETIENDGFSKLQEFYKHIDSIGYRRKSNGEVVKNDK